MEKSLSYKEIEKQINNKNFAPLYLLYGEEMYFIDKLTKLIEEKAMDGIEKSFNCDILFGPDVSANQVIATARAYPTMSPRRLVILKEAHRMKKDEQDKLYHYTEKPVPTTVFVLVYASDKKPDGKTKYGKSVVNNAIVFESKPVRENQVTTFISDYLKHEKIQIEPDALQVLVASLGTNLHLIDNEMQKFVLHFQNKQHRVINRPLAYDFVSIDKDFNVFELQNYLGDRNSEKAHQVISFMMHNSKDNSPFVIVSLLFSFYSKLLILKQQKLSNDNDVARILGINPYFAKDYIRASNNYDFYKLQENLNYILEADLSLKGVRTTNMNDVAIMKTLIYQLLQ